MDALTYLLIDFENLQPPAEDVARVRGDGYRLWVFHGPHQNKFAAEMVVAWQPLGDRVRFVQSSKTGKNALDFHIAFCLGQAQQQDADAKRAAKYIVVSKDAGFDPLFDHMRSLGCAVGKAVSIPDALALAKQPKLDPPSGPDKPSAVKKASTKKAAKKSSKKKSVNQGKSAAKKDNGDDLLDKLIGYLQAHPNNRPTTQQSFANHIPNMVGGAVTKKQIAELMKKLVSVGAVTIAEQKVEYKIPKSRK